VFLRLAERWPSAGALAAASPGEIEAFARSCRHGWPGRFADRVAEAMAAPRLAPRPELARAKAGAIRLAAAQLLAIRAQRREWERRMGELLPGAPRHGRAKTPKDPDPGTAFPGGEIYLSMPGLGDRLAARVAGEIGEHFEQFTTPNALQRHAGRAPVTRRSGRSEFTIARRLANNRHLSEAAQPRAF
jgi:transposase